MFFLSQLFKEVSLNFTPTSLKVLDEWINSGEPDKVQAASYLLRDVPKSFVFIHVEFISNLLEQAYELGDDCYQAVSNDLFQSFTINEYSGILGETFQKKEDLALQDRAANTAKQFILGSASHEFYEFLAKHAQDTIKFWEKRWEEEFDEF